MVQGQTPFFRNRDPGQYMRSEASLKLKAVFFRFLTSKGGDTVVTHLLLSLHFVNFVNN